MNAELRKEKLPDASLGLKIDSKLNKILPLIDREGELRIECSFSQFFKSRLGSRHSNTLPLTGLLSYENEKKQERMTDLE